MNPRRRAAGRDAQGVLRKARGQRLPGRGAHRGTTRVQQQRPDVARRAGALGSQPHVVGAAGLCGRDAEHRRAGSGVERGGDDEVGVAGADFVNVVEQGDVVRVAGPAGGGDVAAGAGDRAGTCQQLRATQQERGKPHLGHLSDAERNGAVGALVLLQRHRPAMQQQQRGGDVDRLGGLCAAEDDLLHHALGAAALRLLVDAQPVLLGAGQRIEVDEQLVDAVSCLSGQRGGRAGQVVLRGADRGVAVEGFRDSHQSALQ